MILALVIVVAGAYYWYSETMDKVSIVGMEAPEEIGVLVLNQMEITLQNNETRPVEVSLQIENALVDENGTSIPIESVLWISEEGMWYDQEYPLKEITLKPGNNTIMVYIGSLKTGTYDVSARVSYKGMIVDEGIATVKVLPAELALDMETRKATVNNRDIYGVDISLLNVGIGRALGKSTKSTIQVFNEKNGELLYEERLSQEGHFSNWNISEWNIPGWTASPTVLIEIVQNGTSEEEYKPLDAVIKGKAGDIYRINVTTLWDEQVLHKEVIIPPA